MNHLIKLSFLLLFISTFSVLSFAQNWGNGVKGKGEIVSKELNLAKFTGVELSTSGDVILTKGATQKVRVEAQQNIIDLLNTEISKGIWDIEFTKNVSNYKSLKIYITIPTLTKVGISGSGNISTTNAFKNADDLFVFVSGSGNLDLDVSAKSTKTKLSGSGNIMLKGASDYQEIKISGSGNIKAYDFEVEEADVTISGSGECRVHVTQKLNARISGSGDITYRGDPSIRANVTGSGDVRKKG